MKIFKYLICFFLTYPIGLLAQNVKKCDYYFEIANISLNVIPANLSENKVSNAIINYTKAIKCNKKFWQAYRNRGKAYLLLKKYNLAFNDFDYAIKLVSKDQNPELLFNRGCTLYELGEYMSALNDFNTVIPLMGNPDYVYLFRAKTKWKLNLKKEACNDLKIAIKDNPEYINEAKFIECDK